MAGLCALRKLDLDHLDLGGPGLSGNPILAKRAVFIAATEIAAAELPDQIPAEFAMVSADRAFPGIMRKSTELGALVERADGVRAQRAEAHGGNIQQRQIVGLPALAAADLDAEEVSRAAVRQNRMIDPCESAAVDILLRAEGPLVELAFGALIGNRTFRAVERRPVGVALEKVLADFGTDFLEPEAEVGQDRIVAAQCMPDLQQVPDPDRNRPRACRRQDGENIARRTE